MKLKAHKRLLNKAFFTFLGDTLKLILVKTACEHFEKQILVLH